ncbi:MAG: GyrI-like domain-containing protein [Pseudonocardiales bacterium]|nr:GyrI-like domain-containing protein [Pseudonocardiales bacterium]
MTAEPCADDGELPFVRGEVPGAFHRGRVELRPGAPRAYVPAEWDDTLVVVERGRLDLDLRGAGVRSFPAGSVLHLDGLALRALHCPGPDPTVLVTVRRRRAVEPRIVDLPDRPYLGARTTCTEATMHAVADRIPAIVGHVLRMGGVLAGAPFIRYHRLGPDGELDAEAGVPVDDPALATDAIPAGTLPGGRYAVTVHDGHRDGLPAATAGLLAWAEDRGVAWDRADSPGGEVWGCRAEHFLTGPAAPDPTRHRTELCFRLAD